MSTKTKASSSKTSADLKAAVAKLKTALETMAEEKKLLEDKLEMAEDALAASEAERQAMQAALLAKEDEHKALQDKLNSRTAAPAIPHRELTDSQRTSIGILSRKVLWEKYKMVNELSFQSGEIMAKCHEELGLRSAQEKAGLEKSIRLEYCRTLSQHKYHVKNMVMCAWEGKFFVCLFVRLFLSLCIEKSN